jgi:hypothetical protein
MEEKVTVAGVQCSADEAGKLEGHSHFSKRADWRGDRHHSISALGAS